MLEWAEAQKTVGDIRVPFQQTRTSPALKKPAIAEGVFWRFSDGAFRWQLGEPPATVLVHDLESFRVRESADAPWQVVDEDDGRYRMWSRFLSGREAAPEDLTKNFTIKASTVEPGITVAVLTPKPLVMRRFLRQVELYLDAESKRLRQLRVVQGDGATVTMRFGAPQPVAAGQRQRLLAK